jgi:hypothetical protein
MRQKSRFKLSLWFRFRCWLCSTCHGCPDRKTCEYAFDPYNTHGDCLAMK